MTYLVELVDDYGNDIWFVGPDLQKASDSFYKIMNKLSLKEDFQDSWMDTNENKEIVVVKFDLPFKNKHSNINFLKKASDLEKSLYLKEFEDNWEEKLD
jgi:hypothetical protein